MAAADITLTDLAPRAAARAVVTRGARARWWRRCGSKSRGFYYVDAAGRRVTDPAALARLRALAIPPAWTSVRVAPSPRSALQAIGVDAAGRVQYLYEPGYCARQQRKKYEKLLRFGAALPALRRATNTHLRGRGASRERVLAVVVRLINDLYFRVGSESSVRRYRTYGVTTLRNRHLSFGRGGQLVFSFVGKHHVRQRSVLVDGQLAALMRDIKAIGGAKLFEYVDDEGRVRPVTPNDVNAFIKSLTSPEFSAKDFRTWGATLRAAVALAELGPPANKTDAKRKAAAAVRRVAEQLGNTPAVCRTSYIHPAVFDCYAQGLTLAQFRPRGPRRVRGHEPDYLAEELALLRLLQAGQRVARTAGAAAARRAA